MFVEGRADIYGGGIYVCGGEGRNFWRGGLIFLEGRADISGGEVADISGGRAEICGGEG